MCDCAITTVQDYKQEENDTNIRACTYYMFCDIMFFGVSNCPSLVLRSCKYIFANPSIDGHSIAASWFFCVCVCICFAFSSFCAYVTKTSWVHFAHMCISSSTICLVNFVNEERRNTKLSTFIQLKQTRTHRFWKPIKFHTAFCWACKKSPSWITTLKSNYMGFFSFLFFVFLSEHKQNNKNANIHCTILSFSKRNWWALISLGGFEHKCFLFINFVHSVDVIQFFMWLTPKRVKPFFLFKRNNLQILNNGLGGRTD